MLGARYDGSPIVVPDGTQPPPEDCCDYVPSACPGCLAPHAWLSDGSSLYDHFGPGLTLLALTPGETQPLEWEAGRRGIPLKILALDKPSLRDRYRTCFALIRPDQHVAWRGDVLPEPGPLLDQVTGYG